MNLQQKILAVLIILPLITFGNNNKSKSIDEAKAFSLVDKMVKKVGNYESLKNMNDVIYTYTYKASDGKIDQSIEKYIFEGELSYGQYTTHQRTFIDLEGIIEQGYDGSEFWLKHKGEIVNDKERLKRVAFNRPTNYYWFTMMQKLMDPGLTYEYEGETTLNNQGYDIVKVSFEKLGDKASDIYQLYINKQTALVDQFLFTVVDFNVVEEPFLMVVEYEKIGKFYIPTKRKYKKSTWEAKVTDKPWIEVSWTNIKFNNNLKKEYFNKNYKMEMMNITTTTSNLKSKLDEKKANFETRASNEKKKIYGEGIDAVAKSGIIESAINVGDKAPYFTLRNANNDEITLEEQLKNGPVVLTWYRGGWCPYCNITLHALQEELPNFKANGASLIALTPELPDNSLSTAEKNELEFEVLSDIGNKVAKEYGIVFELIQPVADSYNKSFDLLKYNGDNSNELPLAASYIIDTNGTIIYAFLDSDYRNRAEPGDLTKILEKHAN